MSKLFIDSSAWIEYFAGTEKGRRVRNLTQKENALIITGLIVSEVCAKFLKDGLHAVDAATMLRSQTVLQPFGYELCFETAKIIAKERKTLPKFGLADAHVLAAARLAGAKVITCDNDFSGFPDAVVIR